MSTPLRPLHLARTFVHLGDDKRASPLEVTGSFWSDLAGGRWRDLGPGRLASYYEMDRDWDQWERHPAGDELVCLVKGRLELHLELPQGDASLPLETPGAFALVPRGVWHTARVSEPSAALFVTPGEGTEHRPA